jgi:DMSO/TMAO reductase YedYZ heme-binding membrane subunit
VIVTASFYVRRHIGQRAWRTLHYLTFLAFLVATAHGIASGTDSGTGWAQAMYIGSAVTVGFLLTYRIVVSVAARRSAGAAGGALGASSGSGRRLVAMPPNTEAA